MRRIPLTLSAPLLLRISAALMAALVATSCASGPDPVPAGPPPAREASSPPAPPLRPGDLVLTVHDQRVPTTALLQAVSAPRGDVVWASGHEGRWLRSEDGGGRWFAGRGPGGDSLQFRDVDAFDGATAYLMSAGEGSASRIYRTDDGGDAWTLQYVADDPEAFLDCMAFWDRRTGVVYGDAVDGAPFVLRTSDGGLTWGRVPPAALPAAQPGEGGFAASGTCAATGAEGHGWIATGNAERARILTTADSGRTWAAVEPPVVGGEGAGLTTVAVRHEVGVAVGGVLGQAEGRGRYVTVTADGGRTWTEGGSLALAGAVYGVAIAPGLPGPVAVAVGPGGMDWSVDGGRTWEHVDDRTFWTVGFAPDGTGWAAGPDGRVVRIDIGASPGA